MIDAPVSGGSASASAGTLTFMVGGNEAAFNTAKPLLADMGKSIFHAGKSGNGQVAKIANNMLLGVSMIATSEAFVLAQRLGLDPMTFFEISSNSSGQNWSMTRYCPAPGILEGVPSNNGYEAGFSVEMMLKDLNLADQSLREANMEAVCANAARSFYQCLSDEGEGSMDFSGAIKKINAQSAR